MAYTPNLQLEAGGFTDFEGNPLNLGYLVMELSHDEQFSAGPNQVVAGLKKRITLDSNGNIPVSPATLVYSNDVLTPANSFYTVQAYKADGTRAWRDQQFWTLAALPDPLDVGTIIPTNPPGGGLGSGTGLLLETNGTANTDQALLNIAQGTNVTITNIAGTTTINAASGGASFTTAGQGFFYGFQDVLPIVDGSGTLAGVVSTNNAIGVAQLNLLYTITIRNISAYVITASGSGTMCAAIYSADGNTKLVEATGGFDAHTASQTLRNVALGSPVTLSPGSYLFACGTTNTSTGSVVGHGPYNSNFLNNLLNANHARVASAANAISGTTMPTTLGVLTPFDHSSPTPSLPAVLFQP